MINIYIQYNILTRFNFAICNTIIKGQSYLKR